MKTHALDKLRSPSAWRRGPSLRESFPSPGKPAPGTGKPGAGPQAHVANDRRGVRRRRRRARGDGYTSLTAGRRGSESWAVVGGPATDPARPDHPAAPQRQRQGMEGPARAAARRLGALARPSLARAHVLGDADVLAHPQGEAPHRRPRLGPPKPPPERAVVAVAECLRAQPAAGGFACDSSESPRDKPSLPCPPWWPRAVAGPALCSARCTHAAPAAADWSSAAPAAVPAVPQRPLQRSRQLKVLLAAAGALAACGSRDCSGRCSVLLLRLQRALQRAALDDFYRTLNYNLKLNHKNQL